MRPDKDESTNNEDQPRRFSESLNSVLAKLPEPLRLRLEAAGAAFLAAQKSTQPDTWRCLGAGDCTFYDRRQ